MIKWIDFKVTTWERIEFNDKIDEEELLHKLKTKQIESVSDMYETYQNLSSSLLTEHTEQLSVKENKAATIEVYSEEGSIIFDNEKNIITLRTKKKK